MRGIEVSKVLADIETVLESASASPRREAVRELMNLVAHDTRSIDDIAKSLERSAQESIKPVYQQYLEELLAAEYDEKLFLEVFGRLSKDKAVKKSDVLKIALSYGRHRSLTGSVDKLLQDVRTSFYERVYERDAQLMAKRATPY